MKQPEARYDLALLLLRLALGAVMLYAGLNKATTWFGGPGLDVIVNAFQENMGIPAPATYLAVVAEVFGGLGVLVGALTRIAAFGTGFTMLVATWTKVQGVMNGTAPEGASPMQEIMWPGSWLIMSVALMLVGAGRASIDHALFGRKKKA